MSVMRNGLIRRGPGLWGSSSRSNGRAVIGQVSATSPPPVAFCHPSKHCDWLTIDKSPLPPKARPLLRLALLRARHHPVTSLSRLYQRQTQLVHLVESLSERWRVQAPELAKTLAKRVQKPSERVTDRSHDAGDVQTGSCSVVTLGDSERDAMEGRLDPRQF